MNRSTDNINAYEGTKSSKSKKDQVRKHIHSVYYDMHDNASTNNKHHL